MNKFVKRMAIALVGTVRLDSLAGCGNAKPKDGNQTSESESTKKIELSIMNWGFTPTPKGDSKQAVLFDSVGWASPSGIRNSDAVWKLMKYMDTKMYEKVLPATPVAPTAFVASSQPYYDKLKSSGHEDVAVGLNYYIRSNIYKTAIYEKY